MKDKVLTLIIGILIGAILATGGFFIYSKVNKNDNQNETTQGMNGGQPPEMPSDSNGNSSNGGQMPQGNPPAKPGESTDSNSNGSSSSSSSSRNANQGTNASESSTSSNS